MDEIARRSGVAKPVYYRYFADKADLHRAVGRSMADAVVRHVTAAVDAAGTPSAKLAAGIDAYLRQLEAEPALYAFVVHGAPTPRRVSDDPVEDYATVIGLHITAVIGDLLRQAGADAGAAEPWGFGLVGMVRSAADRWLTHPTMSRAALVGYLTELAAAGLSAAMPADPGATSLEVVPGPGIFTSPPGRSGAGPG